MKNSTIISILKSLSKKELKEFDRFIVSPFFNNQPSLTRFYNEIRRFYPDFNTTMLERRNVYKNLYPGREYSDDTIRRLSSDLKKVFDEYIYYKASEKMKGEASFLKATEYTSRGLLTEAGKELESINKFNKSGSIGHEFLKNSLSYEELKAQIELRTDRQQFAAQHFLNETEFVIYNFILRLAYSIHNTKANKLIFNLKEKEFVRDFISSINFEKITKLIDSEKETNNINRAMKVYILLILNNLNEKEEKYYAELKSFLPGVINLFTDHEKYNIYQLAEAICWRKMETINRDKYRRELFEINKQRLGEGVFSPDGKNMRLMFYRQVFMSAIQLNEYKWAEDFVNKYSANLPPEIQVNMKKFSEAHILFEKGDYSASLSLLNKVDFEIFTLKFDLRNLLLRIYIELNYIEEAISLLDSYKHFIANNKNVSVYYRTLAVNFLKYCKYIIDLKSGKDKTPVKQIIEQLDKENSVNFRPWLLEKIKIYKARIKP